MNTSNVILSMILNSNFLIISQQILQSTMGDEGFNPCECMWNYLSIQHLLSIVSRNDKYINAVNFKTNRGQRNSTDLYESFESNNLQ